MIDTKTIREAAEDDYFALPETTIALCNEIDSLRQDAMRYRWLTADHPDHATRQVVAIIGGNIDIRGKGNTDAAIDTAMK